MPATAPSITSSCNTQTNKTISVDDLCFASIERQGGYLAEQVCLGFERTWLNSNKVLPRASPMLDAHDVKAFTLLHQNELAIRPALIRHNASTCCSKHRTTLLLCFAIFGTSILRSFLFIASSLGSNIFLNIAAAQQLYVASSFILSFACLYATVCMIESDINEFLAVPPIVIHDVVSVTFRESSLVFRLGPFVEVVHYDPTLVTMCLVSKEHIPYPSIARRAIRCSIKHNETDLPLRATHTCRVLISAALSRLNAAMYDCAIGIKEDTDHGMYTEINKKNMRMMNQTKGSQSDNIEAWRFAQMKDNVSNLLNSTRVGMDRMDKRTRLLKKIYKQGVQALSIEETLRYLVLRISYTAVEQSILSVLPRDARTTTRSQDHVELCTDGRTTTLRFFPSLKDRLSIPTIVWKDVIITFREHLLEMGKMLEGQTNIEPGQELTRLSLLDSLMAPSVRKQKNRQNSSMDGNTKGRNETEEDDLEFVEILRGDVVDHVVNFILKSTFAAMVDILQKSFVPDSNIGL